MRTVLTKLKSNEGSVLFVVLVIMTVAVLLGTSALALTRSDYKQTQIDYIETQAYYTANAALEGIISHILSEEGATLRSKIIEGNILTGTMPSGDPLADRIGSYNVTIERYNGDIYRITSFGNYAGITEQVSAYIQLSNKPLMDGVFTSTGKAEGSSTSFTSSSIINGKASFKLDTLLFTSGTMYGTISNTGDIKLGTINYISTDTDPLDIICGGNLDFSGASNVGIKGGIYVGGDVSVSGGLEIKDATEIYVGGNFTGAYENIGTAANPINLYISGNYVNPYEMTVYGDIYVGGYYNAPKIKVYGTVYIAGSEDIPPSRIMSGTTVVKNTEVNMSTLNYKLSSLVKSDDYDKWEIENSKFIGTNIEITFTETVKDATISQSGTITKYGWSPEWIVWEPKTITFDTTLGDLYIKVDTGAGTFSFGNNTKVNIIGNNNVYFVLADGMGYYQFNANVGSLSETPRFFLVVNGGGEVAFGNHQDLTFNGYIYAPNSKFNISSASSPFARLRGGVVAGYIDHGSCALTFEYIKPPEEIPYSPLGGNEAKLSGYNR